MANQNSKFKQRNFIPGLSRCKYCEVLLHPDICEVDHVIPKSKGGSNNKQNIVLSCGKCNRLKWNYSLSELEIRLLNKKKELLSTVRYYNKVLKNIKNV